MALFTKENAGEMARRATAARIANMMAPDPIPEPARNAIPDAESSPEDDFRKETLARVREHLKALSAKMDAELDKPKINTKSLRDLTDAISKLETVEQRLSNRPAPGSLRPTSDKPKARRNTPAPEPEDLT